MKTLKIWIWIFAVVMIIMILLYFIQFSGKLSEDNADWGTFGDYLSGVFAVFNLGVVVLLTLYVSHKEDLRDKLAKGEQEIKYQKDLEFQRERSERELEVQRKILLSNYRYSELQELENKLNLWVAYQDKADFDTENLDLAATSIMLFYNQKKLIFNTIEHKDEIIELYKSVTSLKYYFENTVEIDGDEELSNKDLNDTFLNYKKIQFRLFEKLYKFTFDELSK